ncbi:MAG: hypothetical protein Q8P16_02745 [bacterium]|nr:hypothetical protein [bacterium]
MKDAASEKACANVSINILLANKRGASREQKCAHSRIRKVLKRSLFDKLPQDTPHTVGTLLQYRVEIGPYNAMRFVHRKTGEKVVVTGMAMKGLSLLQSFLARYGEHMIVHKISHDRSGPIAKTKMTFKPPTK